MADAPADWVDTEPGLRAAGAELARMARRASRRPLLTIALALAVTTYVTLKRGLKTERFSSTVILRVTEGDLDTATALRPPRKLHGYVTGVAFSNERLIDLARKRRLYARGIAKDPAAAADDFRQDIVVEVWRNYFLWSRGSDEARSARIAITYRAADPRLAYDVAQDLASLVVATQESTRVKIAEGAADDANRALEDLKQELAGRREALERQELLARGGRPEEMLRLMSLRKSLEAFDGQLAQRVARKQALEMRAEIERRHLGLMFEVVDHGRVESRLTSRRRAALLFGAVLFPMVLLLAGIAVGAFDPRVHGVEDVTRLGLHALGHVAHFPGDRLDS